MKFVPRTRLFSRGLSLLGIVALSYLAGASVIFFGLPSSDFLERAMIGGQAWIERSSAPTTDERPTPVVAAASAAPTVDDSTKTCDGFTLYACADREGEGTEALLIDMRGTLVHRWSLPHWQFRLYQPSIAKGPYAVHNFKPCFYGFHLDARGDLLVVSHGAPPVAGCGLMKLDIDSNVTWEYPASVHHDIDVDGEGKIYAIQIALLVDSPAGLEHIQGVCQTDELVVLSPEGKPVREPISIVEAIRTSPYAELLSALRATRETHSQELLHTNFVEVLRPELAAKFPDFKAGQVLISMCDLDAIAVLDVPTGSVVWAASGPWRGQHAPHFLDNGHLLIFDNRGGLNGSRVLEYDPRTQTFPWSYPGVGDPTFYTSERGMSQRLPNGNTLIVDSEGGQMMEVTRDRELVWKYSTGEFITTARRYAADELPFLGGQRARP